MVGGSSGPQIVIRTRSLNDLGGPPQTQYTFQNTKGATVEATVVGRPPDPHRPPSNDEDPGGTD